MASVQDRLKIRRENVATWSTREQLCLASSVLKSGDQNWIAVSRSLRPFAEKDVLRPADWFSQKSCAIQYALLLENADTPKRKKRESGETTGESIVKRLTQERITELGQILALQRDEYQQLKADLNMLKSGPINDEKLQKMWAAIEQEEREQEQKTKTQTVWSIKRPQKQEILSQATPATPKKTSDNNEPQETIEIPIEVDDDKKTLRGQSTLLTTLLKSPSPTTQIQNVTSTAQVTSPTIASLLGSSPKIITTSQTTTNVTPQLHQLVSCAMSTGTSERPSAGAPTLSMLLALPANLSKGILPSLPNTTSQNSSIDSSSTSTSVKQINQNCPTVQGTGESSELPEAESMVQIIDHIDGVIGKDKIADVIDKDEINEIIGDIEELIKEEITRSPQTTEASAPVVIETLPLLPEKPIEPEQPESENIDEPVSLPNSPESEMAIEEIDHSTSNIAEIIGTAIESTETKSDDPITSENDLFTEDKPEEDQSVETEIKTEEKDIVTPVESISDSTKVKEVDEKMEERVFETENTEEIPEVQLKDVEIQESKGEVVIPEEKKEREKEIEEEEEEEEKKVVEKKEVIEKEEQQLITEHDKSDDILLKLDESDENKKTKEISISLDKEEIVENKEKVEEANEESKNCILDTIDIKDEGTEESKVEKVPEVEEQTIEKESIIEPVEEPKILESKEEEKKEKEEVSSDTEKLIEESKMKVEENETITEILEEKIKESKEVTDIIEDVETEVTKIEEKNIEKPELAPILSEVSDVKENITENTQEVTEMKIETKNNVEENEKKNEEAIPVKEEIVEEKSGEAEEVQEEIKEVKEEKIQKEMEVEEKVEETEKKKDSEEVEVKKEETNTTEDADAEEEESSLTKLSGRAMKTYSKKYNATVDSEPETESSEGADYRAWKKAVMVVYNRLATHKYASVFLRPITEDQAPGYHSVIFRPMDLSTIKKNIDNGTIRSTMQFQRDVMLMFQNAIMYNKHDTFVYKMTMTMQEECLQHMQILVQVTGEGPFRRETRTAASSSNDLSENNIVKRKRSHITPSPHDSESPRMKKRRKSEND